MLEKRLWLSCQKDKSAKTTADCWTLTVAPRWWYVAMLTNHLLHLIIANKVYTSTHLMHQWWIANWILNTLRLIQDGRHFTDDIFKGIFLNENIWIPIAFSLKFVCRGPINNNPALVQIMAWYRSGDKPLSEAMMVSLPTHRCVTQPQWVRNYFQ